MPAGLMKHDGMFSVRETPWHGLGAVLEQEPRDIQQALELAHLDWEVEQIPVKLTIDGETKVITDENDSPMYFANVRSDTKMPLGIVSKRYTPVQNREAFEFLSNVFGSEMHFETAGSLMNGRRAWVMMKLPEWVEVGGDPVGQYAFISNSHDGKSSVLAAMTAIRIVCMNTLGAALRRAVGGDAQRTYNIRHLGDMSNKIAEARSVLDVTINYYTQFKGVGDKLALAPVNKDKAQKALETYVIPSEEGMGDRAARNREEARQAVMSLFTGEVGSDTLGNSPRTAWSFYNSTAEYADWSRGERKAGGRFQRAIDDPDGMKGRAWESALDMAGLLV